MNQQLLMTTNQPYEDLYPTQTIWVRGVCLTLTAEEQMIQIKVGDYLVDQVEQTFQSLKAFQTFVDTYKYDLIQEGRALKIPKARANAVDEFIYRRETGELAVLSGFANFEWTVDQLQSTELDSGCFYLAKTNETLGTLVQGKTYTIIQFLNQGGSIIQPNQTLAMIKEASKDSNWMEAYLKEQLLIFDESSRLQLTPSQWDPMFVAALNDNSGLIQLPTPLTKELKQVYFARQDLQRRFGFNVDKAKVVPSAFTIRQTKGNQVKVIRYYHSDIIPQHFFCKCGKNKQSTGPVSHRICLDCLQAYQEKSRQQSIQHFKTLMDEIQPIEPIEKVFMVMHTSQGRVLGSSVSQKKRELINVCLMNAAGELLLKSLIKPTTTLSKSSRERGYQPMMFETAPSFEEIQPQIESLIRGKVVVYFNAKERQSFYQELCQQQGLSYEPPVHTLCLKEVLTPLSKASKQIRKILADEEMSFSKNTRGLSAECRAFGIDVNQSLSIQEDANIMRQIYQQLVMAG